MEIVGPLILLLVALGFIISIRVRWQHTRGGITDRPGDTEDAEGFRSATGDGGTR